MYVDHGVGTEGSLMRLWAPYRSQYLADKNKSSDPFVDILDKEDAEALIVARGELCFCVLNLFPYNPGHMMIVPYRQVAEYEDLTEEELRELSLMTQKAIRVLKYTSQPHAINVGMNLGRASGGSIPEHLHQHIVPRWTGDASFMTVLSGTKVLPQLLQETRAILAQAWQEIS